VDAKTGEFSYYDIPDKPRGAGGLGGGMRRGITDAKGRLWWGGFDGNFVGVLDPSLPKNRPENVKREIKKNTRMKGREPSTLWLSLQMLFHRAWTIARSLAGASSDDLAKFRNKLLLKEQRGRSKLPQLPDSIDARAKLQFALSQYRLRRFEGPVDLLASPERDPDYPWLGLLPQMRVHRVFAKHEEVSGAAAARVIQSIIDGVLARPNPSTIAKYRPNTLGEQTV
jgi:hypothetical protein